MIAVNRLSAFAISLSMICLTGCGFNTTAGPIVGEASAKITGKVFGGQQPVLGAMVSVVEVGTTGYGSSSTVLATTLSSIIDGTFNFPAGSYRCPYANTPVYLLAQRGDAGGGVNLSLTLAAGLGTCSSAQSQQVNINEVTTVATAFALGQFFTTKLGATDDFGAPDTGTAGTYSQGLTMANSYTIPTLVNLPFGTVNPGTSNLNVEAPKIYSIANTLAACVNSDGLTGSTDNCGILFADTTPPGGTAPTDTLQAAVQMSLYPYQNVKALYALGTPTAPYVGLSSAPNDFTVGVSYTTTALGLSIGRNAKRGTSSNIDIDASGRIWVPSNLPGAVGLAYFDPTTTSFSAAFSDGNLVHPQYLAIDLSGDAWVTDLVGNYFEAINTSTTDVDYSFFYTPATVTDGPIGIDSDNTVYFSTIYEKTPYLTYISADRSTADPTSGQAFDEAPTGLAPLADGGYPNYYIVASASGRSTACYSDVSYTGGGYGYFAYTSSDCESGGVALTAGAADAVSIASTLDQICSAAENNCFAPAVPVYRPEGVATDGYGALWLANSGNGSISTMNGDYSESSPVAYLHNSTHGDTMSAPYGLAIDNSGNVWVSNAGCFAHTKKGCTPTSLTLSELVGAAGPTITPLSAQGAGTYQGTLPDVAKKSPGMALKNAKLLEKQTPSNGTKLEVTKVR